MIKHLYLRCIGNENFGLGHVKRIEVISKSLNDIKISNTIIVKKNTALKKNNPAKLLGPPLKSLFLKNLNFFYLCDTHSLIGEARELKKNLPQDSTILFDISNKHVIKKIDLFKKYFFELSKLFNLIIIDSVNNECISNYVEKKIFKKIIIPYENSNVPKNCKKISSGLKYLTLNKKLFIFKNRYKKSPITFKITVCFGGADPYSLNRYFLKLISNYKKRKKIKILIIFGPLMNKNKKFILMKESKKLGIKFLNNPKNFYDLITKSSITVTATGIIKYELAKMGVPSIMIAHDRYSIKNNLEFSKKGTGLIINKEDSIKKNSFKVHEFINNKKKLKWFSKNGLKSLPQSANDFFIKKILED